MASEIAPPETSPSLTVTILRVIIDEIHNCAHDPQMVHMAADKLKHAIDSLEHALTEQAK